MCPPVFPHGAGRPGDEAGSRDVRRPAGCPSARLCGDLAMDRWERLRATLIALGHRVSLMPGRPGLPDMVFAARSATVPGDRTPGFAARLSDRGYRPIEWDLSEFSVHGAGARSCVLVLRTAR
jgi:N-dimethylarginine dimethylaminohydrolase